MEINEYLKSVIYDEEKCKNCTKKLENDGHEFFRSEYPCTLKNEILLELIQSSRKSKVLQRFLASFAYCLKAEEVTPQIFKLFLKYKGKFRDTILMALSHAPLSVYQLQILAKLNIDDAAFCQLVLLYCKIDCFSENDLLNLLQENISNKEQLPHLYQALSKDVLVSARKIKIVETFIGRIRK